MHNDSVTIYLIGSGKVREQAILNCQVGNGGNVCDTVPTNAVKGSNYFKSRQADRIENKTETNKTEGTATSVEGEKEVT